MQNPNLQKKLKLHIANSDDNPILDLLKDLHYADIAELLNDLSLDNSIYILKLLNKDITSDILTELDEDVREKILESFSTKEIAEEIDELNTDDAADIISELPDHKKSEVISQIEDIDHAKDIVDLLRYKEGTAGSLMEKEVVQVNENWANLRCVKEMRAQASKFDIVHTIYVINNDGILKGRLSLKILLTTATDTAIKEVYNPKITSVSINEDVEEVGKIMQKYDLFVVPVIDEIGRLVGQITIDDMVDIIKDEAEKDYQMAAGITEDVEADEDIKALTRARLPRRILGLFGGLASVFIMQGYEEIMQSENMKKLFFFTPLIAAMAGNVGVQSSAIVVQGLANDVIKGSMWSRLLKEISLSIINGLVLALFILIFGFFMNYDFMFSLTISIAMVSVIMIAGIIGTFIPILLHKQGIDPALATGPFITTSNDIFGIYLFFFIAKLILVF